MLKFYVPAFTIRLRISLFTINVESIGIEQKQPKQRASCKASADAFPPSRNEIIEQIQFVIAMSTAHSTSARAHNWVKRRQKKTGFSISNSQNVRTIFYLRTISIRILCTPNQFSMWMDARFLSSGLSKFRSRRSADVCERHRKSTSFRFLLSLLDLKPVYFDFEWMWPKNVAIWIDCQRINDGRNVIRPTFYKVQAYRFLIPLQSSSRSIENSNDNK